MQSLLLPGEHSDYTGLIIIHAIFVLRCDSYPGGMGESLY